MKILSIIFLCFLFLFIQSCATLISGSHQKISFSSEPSGAQIYINGENSNRVTPAVIQLPRKVHAGSENIKNQYIYTFKHEGYNDAKVFDYAELNSWVWMNFIGGGFCVFTFPVDFISGASKQYNSQVQVLLNKSKIVTDTVVQKQIVYVPTGGVKNVYSFERKSDVDNNIPTTPNQNSNRYALIIGNEDYSSHQVDLSSEVNVDFARNDASAFKEYAINVLGIPKENMIFMLDATTGQMSQAIAKANLVIKNTKGNAEVFIYYAGHGMPDEISKEPYIMPVDVSGKNPTYGIALKTLYDKLTEFPSKRITVFIDACFSGGARNQGLLAARGVKVNAKESAIGGNLVVFSASSGEQSSLPYAEKQHGLFTYFLLKKLQESHGQVTYNELADYIIDNVSLKSVLVNEKEQNPKVNTSSGSATTWKEWKLNE